MGNAKVEMPCTNTTTSQTLIIRRHQHPVPSPGAGPCLNRSRFHNAPSASQGLGDLSLAEALCDRIFQLQLCTQVGRSVGRPVSVLTHHELDYPTLSKTRGGMVLSLDIRLIMQKLSLGCHSE